MSFALTELSKLLSSPVQARGVVVGKTGNTLRIATRKGLVYATPVNAIVVGDRVTVENGMATKAPVASMSYSV